MATIAENVRILISGWREKVEYTVKVKYHQAECVRAPDCECPTQGEQRSKYMTHKGLLDQLQRYHEHADLGAEPRAERGTPGKSKSRPPASMAGFMLLDEISIEANTLSDRIAAESGRHIQIMPVREIINLLPYQATQIQDSHPHLVRDIQHATDRWIDRAQRVLGLKTTDAHFADNCACGGTLAVGRDARKTSVRCLGECGKKYPMSEWLSLYEGMKK